MLKAAEIGGRENAALGKLRHDAAPFGLGVLGQPRGRANRGFQSVRVGGNLRFSALHASTLSTKTVCRVSLKARGWAIEGSGVEQMNFDRLAGTASAVGILFIVAIVIAAAQPDFKLKDWQVFMAALVALGAATVAYRGAIEAATLAHRGATEAATLTSRSNIAKVDFDRENAERERISKKLALFLRLNLTLGTLEFEIGRALDSLKSFAQASEKGPLSKSSLRVPYVDELNEAWEKLDLFPPEIINEINEIRNILPKLKASLDEGFDERGPAISMDDKDRVISKPVDYGTVVGFLKTQQQALDRAREVVMSIQRALSQEIAKLRIN
jgi:hypothetical protein